MRPGKMRNLRILARMMTNVIGNDIAIAAMATWDGELNSIEEISLEDAIPATAATVGAPG